MERMQAVRRLAVQSFMVFFINSFHNVQIQALRQPKLTASSAEIGEQDSVDFQCWPIVDPEKCFIYLISQTNVQTNIAYSCRATFTGSDLLARNGALADVRVQCYYTVKVKDNSSPSPHSGNVTITVRRGVLSLSPTSATSTTAATTLLKPTPVLTLSPTSATPTTIATTLPKPFSVVPASPTTVLKTTPTVLKTTTTVLKPTPGPSDTTGGQTSGTIPASAPPVKRASEETDLLSEYRITLTACGGGVVFIIILLLSLLITWKRRKKNTQSCQTGSLKKVGSSRNNNDVYHTYCAVSEENTSPNSLNQEKLVYDLLQAQ